MTATATPVPRRRSAPGREGGGGNGRPSRTISGNDRSRGDLAMSPMGRPGGDSSYAHSDDNRKFATPFHSFWTSPASPYRRRRALLLGTFLLGTIVLFSFVCRTAGNDTTSSSSRLPETSALRIKKAVVAIPDNAVVIRRILPDATIQLHLRRPSHAAEDDGKGDSSSVVAAVASLGSHALTVRITHPRRCSSPAFTVRVAGDALVAVRLTETIPASEWSGEFRLPKNGTYALDVRWYGCDWGGGPAATEAAVPTTMYRTLDPPVNFVAVSGDSDDLRGRGETRTTHPPLFAETAAWVRTSSISPYVHLSEELMASSSSSPLRLPPYLWMNYRSKPTAGNLLRTSHPSNGSYVSTEGTLKHPDDYYKFADVSNYELVCMVGSDTMYDTWAAFMDLRPYIFPGQRPFKFHYYNATSFTRPDRHWDEDTKKRIRKCKHVFVSMDEASEPVSQRQYVDQVRTFARHMAAVLRNDTTFPIWFMSVSESPVRATNCLPPLVLPRSTDHPCNDALRHVFMVDDNNSNNNDHRPEELRLPPNVQLMDNTDLSLPQWDDDEHENKHRRADVIAVIAYRIYVVVGKGVADWRAAGQKGDIKGLHRNGTLEPNFVLEPYVGW